VLVSQHALNPVTRQPDAAPARESMSVVFNGARIVQLGPTEMVRPVELVQLLIFLVVEQTHSSSNIVDIVVAFTINYSFKWEAMSLSTVMHS
jgi:hypothetical protein